MDNLEDDTPASKIFRTQKSTGLSLLSLLVGLSLSVLVAQAAFYLYQFVDHQWRLQQAKLILLNKATLGLNVMERSIQRAGYRGCLSKDPNFKITTLGRIAPYFCPPKDLLVQGAEQFQHIAYWSKLDLPIKLINTQKGSHLKPGSDFLSLYHVPIKYKKVSQDQKINSTSVAFYQLNGVRPIAQQRLGLVADCISAVQFQQSKQLPLRFKKTYLAGSEIILFETQAYYVAEVTQRERWLSASQPLYALFQDNLQSGRSAVGRLEIVEGVEDLWIEYGVRSFAQPSLQFLTAKQIKDWKQVKAIKIHLLLRSERPILDRPQKVNWRGQNRLFEDRYYRCAFEQVSVLKNAFQD